MNARWRLIVVGIEILVLWIVTHYYGGSDYWLKPWFIAIVGVIVNGLLVEPYFPKPGDVVASALAFIAVAAAVNTPLHQTAWNVGRGAALVFLFLAIFALAGGAGKQTGRLAAIADVANQLSRLASARVIYSAMFLLATLDAHPERDNRFWILIGGWCVILAISAIDWRRVWVTVSDGPELCFAEGMLGPSTLLINGPHIPAIGSSVILRSPRRTVKGVVVQRLRRKADIWGAILVSGPADCEAIINQGALEITRVLGGAPGDEHVVGIADSGSTDRKVRFVSLRDLEIGDLVVTQVANTPVLYQLSAAEIERLEVKGGSHLAVRATGLQIGKFDAASQSVLDFPWVPTPGARIMQSAFLQEDAATPTPSGMIQLGLLPKTKIPVLMDVSKAREGHIVVLGMTKMGKSTLAERLARKFGEDSCVVVLDQTGEWVWKKGFQQRDKTWTGSQAGVSVFEPKPGEIPPDRALAFLEQVVDLGRKEYAAGNPFPRVAIIDEAHQFIPEPAGLGFNTPGRESAMKIGTLLMQIRKYGICVIMVTQRTAVVSKSALSQCENVIAFRSVDKTGLDYLEGIFGAEACELLPKLPQAHALVYGPAMSCARPAVVDIAK